MQEFYLGDGVYMQVHPDINMVRLDLRGQDDTTFIWLEPETWRTMASVMEKIGWLSKK
jgi:hypothetical protein